MKHAVITGATGFIGTHLVAELLSRGVNMTVLHQEGDPGLGRLPENVRKIACGMDDYERLPEMWDGHADVFFHLAWEGATGAGRADQALQVKNTLRTLNALKAAKEIGCGKFVAAGTVYEKFRNQIADAPEFRNAGFYILGKCYTHDMARQLALKLGISFCWCTFCHPAGRLMKPEQLLAYVVKCLTDGVSPAFGSALEPYDIIDVKDLATGLYLAGETELNGGDYYIGSGNPRTLKEYLEETRAALGVKTPVAYGAKPDDGMRFDIKWFDGSAFAEAAGFTPKISFDETVRSIANG